MNRHAIILFAHGARDPRWAEPFKKVRDRLLERMPAAMVELAFLELMAPDLNTALERVTAQRATQVTVVPMFLGFGAHLQRDLPALLENCRQKYAGVTIDCTVPLGENAQVLDAITDFCVWSIGKSELE